MEKIVEREMMKSFEPAFECLYLGATAIAEDLGYKKGLPFRKALSLSSFCSYAGITRIRYNGSFSACENCEAPLEKRYTLLHEIFVPEIQGRYRFKFPMRFGETWQHLPHKFLTPSEHSGSGYQATRGRLLQRGKTPVITR